MKKQSAARPRGDEAGETKQAWSNVETGRECSNRCMLRCAVLCPGGAGRMVLVPTPFSTGKLQREVDTFITRWGDGEQGGGGGGE